MTDTKILLLFIRAPVKGRVKTRLAQTIGDDAALELYRCFVLDTVQIARSVNCVTRICYHPSQERKVLEDLLGDGYDYMPQQGVNLGEKMENAFTRVFLEGFTRAVLIGSDIPDVSPSVIETSFQQLEQSGTVIGPASDGGYYLIGFNKQGFAPCLFRGIPWGTSAVFTETMRIAQSASLEVRLMPEWNDIDSMDDLKAFFKRNVKTLAGKSRTLDFLSSRKDMLFKLQ